MCTPALASAPASAHRLPDMDKMKAPEVPVAEPAEADVEDDLQRRLAALDAM